jgi:hypothetical protein
MQPGAQGFGAPPVQTFDTELPSVDGGVWIDSRVASRDILLPVMLWSANEADWIADRRRLFSLFTTKGEHQIVVTTPDGLYRALGCRYLSGLESPRDGEQGPVRYAHFAVQMRAYDPYWYGDVRSVTWLLPDSGPDFFPGPDWILTPGNVFGETLVTNDGAIEAWPVWTVSGPATLTEFTGPSGETFSFTGTLTVGESVTINTDPRTPLSQKVIDSDGVNRWGDIAGDGDPFAVFFELPVGESQVSASATGGTADTRITMSWRLAYQTW